MSQQKFLPKLVLATQNPNKIKELQPHLDKYFNLHSSTSVANISWDETGNTFYDNALIKLKAVAAHTSDPIIAEDSGLVVPSLGGFPGVISARYAGEEATSEEHMHKLLKELSKLNDPTRYACFICCMVFRNKENEIQSFVGSCPGTIAKAPSGSGGFGYDPIFIPSGFEKSFSELGPALKQQISHRAQALKLFKQALNIT